MPRRRTWLVVAALLVFTGLVGLALRARSRATPPLIEPVRQSASGPLTILAASSLTEALQAVADAWQAQGNRPVVLSFGASSKLARQVEAGAPADIFVSADREWIDYLEEKRLMTPGTLVPLAGNRLVAIAAPGLEFVPTDVSGLSAPTIHHLALAGEAVPAGRYARAALRSLGAWAALSDRVVSGDNVRSTLSWVASGEAEAGIVYATDLRVEPQVQLAFVLPEDSYPPIVYPAAALRSSPHQEDAVRFLAFCMMERGQSIFAAAGFLPAPAMTPGSATLRAR